MSVCRIPRNVQAGAEAGDRSQVWRTRVSPCSFGTLDNRALRVAHCARRDVREQLMIRREQYIIDPVAAVPLSVSDLPLRGHES